MIDTIACNKGYFFMPHNEIESRAYSMKSITIDDVTYPSVHDAYQQLGRNVAYKRLNQYAGQSVTMQTLYPEGLTFEQQFYPNFRQLYLTSLNDMTNAGYETLRHVFTSVPKPLTRYDLAKRLHGYLHNNYVYKSMPSLLASLNMTVPVSVYEPIAEQIQSCGTNVTDYLRPIDTDTLIVVHEPYGYYIDIITGRLWQRRAGYMQIMPERKNYDLQVRLSKRTLDSFRRFPEATYKDLISLDDLRQHYIPYSAVLQPKHKTAVRFDAQGNRYQGFVYADVKEDLELWYAKNRA